MALSRSSARLGRLSRAGFAYEFSCSEACTATGSISADVPARKSRRTTLASGAVKLAGAGKGRVTVKATTAGRRAIRRLRRGKRRRVKARLTTVVKDSAGNSTTVRKRLTLTR